MNDKQIIEAMAGIEGRDHELYAFDGTRWWGSDFGRIGRSAIPDYLTSHDACQRVIDGFKASELSDYFRELRRTCGCTTMANIEVMLKATPRQKCEAVLKARGLCK